MIKCPADIAKYLGDEALVLFDRDFIGDDREWEGYHDLYLDRELINIKREDGDRWLKQNTITLLASPAVLFMHPIDDREVWYTWHPEVPGWTRISGSSSISRRKTETIKSLYDLDRSQFTESAIAPQDEIFPLVETTVPAVDYPHFDYASGQWLVNRIP